MARNNAINVCENYELIMTAYNKEWGSSSKSFQKQLRRKKDVLKEDAMREGLIDKLRKRYTTEGVWMIIATAISEYVKIKRKEEKKWKEPKLFHKFINSTTKIMDGIEGRADWKVCKGVWWIMSEIPNKTFHSINRRAVLIKAEF